MSKLISRGGSMNFDNSRTDPEEFKKRLDSLHDCIFNYNGFTIDTSFAEKDLKRIDLNSTCGYQLKMVKAFIKKTGLRYENVYAEIPKKLNHF